MKHKKEKKEFEIKKKVYNIPHLKKYGTFAEYTKGSQDGQGQTDALGQYYGSDNLRS